MPIAHYLAMTAAEIAASPVLPDRVGWMACHFSPYAPGLTNLPEALPKGSLLILNDRTAIHKHDPELIADQLRSIIQRDQCCGLLLDFQTGDEADEAALARTLAEVLPCPVCISQAYALPGHPVLLGPVPPDTPLRTHIAPWVGWDIWLETALEGCVITVTRDGAAALPTVSTEIPSGLPADDRLHCHYRIIREKDCFRFQLYRTLQDLTDLLDEADSLGIHTAVGLYQELK